LRKGQIVFDIVYNPKETKLLKEAKKKGAKVIYGWEMLLYQGVAQFEIYTGKKAPVEVMRKILNEKLKIKK
jgi:shikimate 5-dehydrogenase